MGATRPLHPMPRTEAERTRNRRVDILLDAVPLSQKPRIYGMMEFEVPQTGCTIPSPPQTTKVRFGSIVFDAEVVTTGFNPMPRDFIQQVATEGISSPQKLKFSCHRVEASSDCRAFIIPAWAFEGAVGATLPANELPSDWEYGFIQTVQRSRYLHLYDGGAGRECVISAPARDALSGSPPPWVEPAAVTTLDSSTPARMEDSPFTIATISNPATPDRKLRQVCIEGTFLIWLITRKKTASAPVLLLFKDITVGRTWELKQGRDPGDPQAWVEYGGQFESRTGDGNIANPPRPKLNGPTAGSQGVQCFVPVTAKICQTEQQRQFLTHCKVGGVCATRTIGNG